MTQLLFSFYGRLGRLAFFLWSVLITVVAAAAYLVLVTVTQTPPNQTSFGDTMTVVIMLAVLAVTIWVSFALSVKRFHDMEASGWWSFLLIIPYVGFIVAVVLCFVNGTDGPNKYGAEPEETFSVGAAI